MQAVGRDAEMLLCASAGVLMKPPTNTAQIAQRAIARVGIGERRQSTELLLTLLLTALVSLAGKFADVMFSVGHSTPKLARPDATPTCGHRLTRGSRFPYTVISATGPGGHPSTTEKHNGSVRVIECVSTRRKHFLNLQRTTPLANRMNLQAHVSPFKSNAPPSPLLRLRRSRGDGDHPTLRAFPGRMVARRAGHGRVVWSVVGVDALGLSTVSPRAALAG